MKKIYKNNKVIDVNDNEVNIVARQNLNRALTDIFTSRRYSGFLAAFRILDGFEIFDTEDNYNGNYAYTDMKKIYLSNCFLYSYDKESICFAVLHEILHNTLLHSIRAKKIKDFNHQAWNIACDFVINNVLKDYCQFNSLTFDDEPIFRIILDFSDVGLSNVTRSPLSFSEEEIYKIILENKNKLGKDYEDKLTCSEPTQSNENAAAESEQIARKWIENGEPIRKQIGQKRYGTGSSIIEKIFNDIKKVKINWRAILLDTFKKEIVKKDWAKQSRRFSYQRNVIIPRKKIEPNGVLAVARDNSGSISDEDFAKIISYIVSLVKTFNYKTVYLIEFTDEVNDVIKIDTSKITNSVISNLFKRRFNGGTNFIPVFKKIDEIKATNNDFQAAIILTDLQGNLPSIPPTYKVLWLTTENYIEKEPNFGKIIKINN